MQKVLLHNTRCNFRYQIAINAINIEPLEEWLANRKMEAENQEREEKMQFEIKLHETKLRLQEDLQAKAGNQTSVGEVKLPKLVITKFNETYADWPRFWGQYSETIDKSSRT